jgi:hypothetical protein
MKPRPAPLAAIIFALPTPITPNLEHTGKNRIAEICSLTYLSQMQMPIQDGPMMRSWPLDAAWSPQ